MSPTWSTAAALSAALLCAGAAQAKVVAVGPSREVTSIAAASRLVRDGDTVLIDPGTYAECAVWTRNRLIIAGRASGVVIADVSCEGKALFVTRGSDITVRNLTFARARVPHRNGAGIRAEGVNLRVEGSRFIDNENGILAASAPMSTIVIVNSEFARNGKCEPQCAHGIYINTVGLLRVERSRFREQRIAHHIKSRALRTELIGNVISDGEIGDASYLVDIPDGGSLVMRDNVLEKGPHTDNPGTAVFIGGESQKNRTDEIVIAGNRFANRLSQPTVFVRNRTTTPAILTGNLLTGTPATPLVGEGVVR